jgi:DNA-binding transcriptional LysR family regulator
MNELDDLRALVEVINGGGVTRAARRMGVAKSIVSRRIARLEEELGTRLLNRSQHGATATEAGMELHLRAESILLQVTEARDLVTGRRGEIFGRLRVCLPLSFGLRYVAPLLTSWARAQPRLEIEAAYSDRDADLMGERFDAAVHIGALRSSSLVGRRIAPIQLAVVASPSYLATHGVPQAPAELEDHECLIYSGFPVRPAWLFQQDGNDTLVHPSGRFHADNGEALLQAVHAGLGVATLPLFLVAEGLRDGTLVQVLGAYTLPEEGLYVLRPQSSYVPAAVRGLVDLLTDHFADEAPWDHRRLASSR